MGGIMKTLMAKLIKKLGKNKKQNLRKAFRISEDSSKAHYVTLVDKNNNRISGKLLDQSDTGCKIIFSNMKLFIDSEYSLERKHSLANKCEPKPSSVVWSEHFKLDFSRYCVVGLKFK
jgi:hypothetical protein